MRKAVLITAIFSLVAAAGCFAFGRPAWAVGLWVGAAWGLANFWCMAKALSCVVEKTRGLRLAVWIVFKFVILYGSAGLLLLWAKVSPVGWILGFTISLIALGIGAIPSFRSLAGKTVQAVLSVAVLLSGRLSEASEAAHGGGHAESAAPSQAPEIPNFITLITHGRHDGVSHFLHAWESTIYAFVIVLIVGMFFAFGARLLAMRPGRGQAFVEMVIEGLDNLVCGVLGKKEGRRYLPFLGTLFLFILSMNLAGLVPGLMSPTSKIQMTMALGFCVFVFVQGTGLRRLGFVKYMDHMIGEPRDAIGWVLSPLMLFIHGIGEIVKPISLALRLFGNIMGEDTLLGVFVSLGALCFAWSHLPIGVPFHLPFMLLAMIFSTVQALVFTMLSTIYVYMMLPHEDHAEHSGESHGHATAKAAVGKHHEPA